jgi:hypothetical protein
MQSYGASGNRGAAVAAASGWVLGARSGHRALTAAGFTDNPEAAGARAASGVVDGEFHFVVDVRGD